MTEQINLPAAEQAQPGTTYWRVREVTLDLNRGAILVGLLGENGLIKSISWYDSAGEGATALIVSLNKANLTIKSLQRRIIETAQTAGKLAPTGTISGTPD